MQITAPANATGVLWKNEDAAANIGPAWFVTPDGNRSNVYDTDMLDWNGDPFPGWLDRATAVDMARHFGLTFEEA